MNYLAHAFLSNNRKDLLIGNFIADHIRGNHLEAYPPGIIEGIKLHRRIDTFTDEHPLFRKSKRLFYEDFEKHSGILVDIYFDYFLAKDFDKHSQISLDQFSKNVYQVYNENLEHLPETSAKFLSYVITNNIYVSYAGLEGISQVLYHLSHRIKHGVALQESVNVLNENMPEMQANFDEFFKDLKAEFIHD